MHYYLTRLKLAPHETRAIDIAQLRDQQRPDFKGKKIPSGATDGSVNWIRLDNVPVSGRVAVIEKQTGTASSYDCFSCNCGTVFTNTIVLAAAGFTVLPGGFVQLSATCQYRDCNGLFYWFDETNYCSWSSSNSSFATVNSTGGVTGVADGTVTISAWWYACGAYPPWYQGGGCSCTSWISATGYDTGNVGPYPVNFHLTGWGPYGTGDLELDYAWDSSTGNLADLSACVIYEVVDYPNYPSSPYVWPEPPWNDSNDNPVVTGVPATDGIVTDYVLPGGFVKPYQAASFHATQFFRYTCNGGSEQPLMGPLDHFRQVSENPDGTYEYIVTVGGQYSTSINPLP